MAWSTKPVSVRACVGQESACQTAVLRADARGDAGAVGVDGDRVRGPVGVAVVLNHGREVERVGQRARQWRADQSGCVSDHERRFGGGEVSRRDDQIAFVLSQGRVEHDYEVAVLC